jgi:hypothetical protein
LIMQEIEKFMCAGRLNATTMVQTWS